MLARVPLARDRVTASSVELGAPEPLSRRSVVAGPLVAAIMLAAALVATQEAGVPLRDPDHVAGVRLTWVACLVLALVGLDIAVRAGRRTRTLRPSREAMRTVRRERWNWPRGLAAASALVSFWVSYLAYRNLKSVVPVLRPDDLFDRQLADLDRALFFGHDPAALMHSLMGTGVVAQVLSLTYVFFVIFVPVSLALALVFSPNLPGGIYYATAASINWLLGAASYLLLPALGPIYYTPGDFARLPTSAASHLQDLLLEKRLEFLHDPAASGAAQTIAAFASLHVSMTLTAAVVAHLLGVDRRVRIALWTLLGLTTMSTIYLGWHYVVDDVAGVVIAAVALAVAQALTGFDIRSARQRGRATAP